MKPSIGILIGVGAVAVLAIGGILVTSGRAKAKPAPAPKPGPAPQPAPPAPAPKPEPAPQPPPPPPNPQNPDVQQIGEYKVKRYIFGPPGSGAVTWLLHGLSGGLDQMPVLILDNGQPSVPNGEYVVISRGSSWVADSKAPPASLSEQLSVRASSLLALRDTLHGDDPRQWVVVGYSQGGQLGYYLTAGPASFRPPDMLILGAARIPMVPTWQANNTQVTLKILALSGLSDKTVPTDEAQAAAQIFANAGYNVTFQTFPDVGHSLTTLGPVLHNAIVTHQ